MTTLQTMMNSGDQQRGNPRACLELGDAQRAAGELDAAVDSYSAAVRMAPESAEAHSRLGTTLAKLGRLEEAAEALRRCLDINPDDPTALSNLGIVLSSQGELAAAVRCFRKATELVPNFAEAHSNLGVVFVRLNRVPDAICSFEKALQGRPDYPEALNNLGGALRRHGDLVGAIDSYHRAVESDPEYAEAYKNLGDVHRELDHVAEAEDAYRQALERAPNHAYAANQLGQVLQDTGRLGEAIACYQRALTAKPGYAEALNNLATAYLEQGRIPTAFASLQEALAIDPDGEAIHSNLGNAFFEDGNVEQAIACYREAIQLNPDFADAYRNLGSVLRRQKSFSAAINAFAEAVRLQQDHPENHYNLGVTHYLSGSMVDAIRNLDTAIALAPDNSMWKLNRETLCPPVFADQSEIDRYCRRLNQVLDTYLKKPFPFDAKLAEESAFSLPFRLLHLGRDMRAVKEKLARVVGNGMPEYPVRSLRTVCRRVGFVVTAGHEGNFMRMMQGILDHLRAGVVEPYIICPRSSRKVIESSVANAEVRYLTIPEHLSAAADVIHAAEMDILFYRQIGTDSLNYFLPFMRLAPVQCTSFGLHQTSGIANVDYYLSSDHLEPAGAERHYGETLVRLKTLPTFQYRIPEPRGPGAAESFGIPRNAHVYLCPQRLSKMHPDGDRLFRAILRRDPRGVLVIIGDRHGSENAAKIVARFQDFMADVNPRVIVLPTQSKEGFLRLIRTASVVLDTVHYSAGSTAYDIFSMNAPVVTLPGALSLGRYTYACYRIMGIDDLIATSGDHYVDLAVKVATDPEYRDHVRRKIAATSDALFEDEQAVRELERFLQTVVTDQERTEETSGEKRGHSMNGT